MFSFRCIRTVPQRFSRIQHIQLVWIAIETMKISNQNLFGKFDSKLAEFKRKKSGSLVTIDSRYEAESEKSHTLLCANTVLIELRKKKFKHIKSYPLAQFHIFPVVFFWLSEFLAGVFWPQLRFKSQDLGQEIPSAKERRICLVLNANLSNYAFILTIQLFSMVRFDF